MSKSVSAFGKTLEMNSAIPPVFSTLAIELFLQNFGNSVITDIAAAQTYLVLPAQLPHLAIPTSTAAVPQDFCF